MSSVIYIVRSPLHALSQALYFGDDSAVVLSLADPILPGKVVRTTSNARYMEGETLSYEQVLAMLLENKKVMTL